MAIYIEEQRSEGRSTGTKKVNANAQDMIIDLVQKYQYSYPIRSTVRELLSNGSDSLKEKHMAIDILSGHKTVEDYYADLEGDIYSDSKYDPNYYNLQWLDKKDRVELRYVIGSGSQKDKVIISDTGVGVGGKRLEGYFDIGYSTKRLLKLQLGKWGINSCPAIQ